MLVKKLGADVPKQPTHKDVLISFPGSVSPSWLSLYEWMLDLGSVTQRTCLPYAETGNSDTCCPLDYRNVTIDWAICAEQRFHQLRKNPKAAAALATSRERILRHGTKTLSYAFIQRLWSETTSLRQLLHLDITHSPWHPSAQIMRSGLNIIFYILYRYSGHIPLNRIRQTAEQSTMLMLFPDDTHFSFLLNTPFEDEQGTLWSGPAALHDYFGYQMRDIYLRQSMLPKSGSFCSEALITVDVLENYLQGENGSVIVDYNMEVTGAQRLLGSTNLLDYMQSTAFNALSQSLTPHRVEAGLPAMLKDMYYSRGVSLQDSETMPLLGGKNTQAVAHDIYFQMACVYVDHANPHCNYRLILKCFGWFDPAYA